MRLWSIHPKHLDTKGLVALWREALLAQAVLLGNTQGYKNHPQLHRFKQSSCPIKAIGNYLTAVYKEALGRGYSFDVKKIYDIGDVSMNVTKGQVEYETGHLRKKLTVRSPNDVNKLRDVTLHPMFTMVDGGIESWEIV